MHLGKDVSLRTSFCNEINSIGVATAFPANKSCEPTVATRRCSQKTDTQCTCVVYIGGGGGGDGEGAATTSNDGRRRWNWAVNARDQVKKVEVGRDLNGEGQGQPGMIICESRAEFQRQVVAQIAALQRHARLGIQAPVAKERVTHQQLTG